MKKALIISAITLIIVSLFVWHYSTPEKVTPSKPKVVATPTPTPTVTPTPTPVYIYVKPTAVPTSIPTVTPTPQPQQIVVNVIQPTSQPTPTPTPVLKVALEVQGTELGDVIIQDGQNQCDVLSDALAQKVITFLSMKYFTSFDSFGVYQINDIGDPNTVNFVFEVNGVSPDKGCSGIPAKGGDHVHWHLWNS